MFFRVSPLPGNPAGLDMNMMRDFIDDNVRTRMERIPGVSQVDVRGGAERQIRILVDPERLAQRGITLTELRDAIRAAIAWLLTSATRRAACLGAVFLVTIGAIWLLTPPAEYLPEGEEPKAFSRMIAPPGYSLTEMRGIAGEIEAEFLPHVGAAPEPFESGETDIPPLAYFNLSVQPQYLRIISEAREPWQIDELMDVVTERLAAYPGMRAFSARGSIISSNDGGTRSVNLDVGGRDMAAIYRTAELAYRRA